MHFSSPLFKESNPKREIKNSLFPQNYAHMTMPEMSYFKVQVNRMEAATVGIRIFGGLSYTLLSTFGLGLNMILVFILINGRSALQKNAFFTITWQMVVCDVLTHIMEFIVPIPITFAGSDIYGDSLLLYLPAFVDTIAYNGTLYFSFLMTINRFTVFIAPRLNHVLFQSYRLYFTIASMWLWVILLVVGLNVFACYKSFSSTGFYYHHVCPSPEKMSVVGDVINKFISIGSTYFPVAMLVIYVVIIAYIRLQICYEWRDGRLFRKSSRSTEASLSSREFSLLAQSLIICGFLEIQNLAFKFLPQISPNGQWNYVINYAQNWISLLLSSIHPIVLFTFNKDIRKRLITLFSKFFKTALIVPSVASINFSQY